jgi:hypothetical protein
LYFTNLTANYKEKGVIEMKTKLIVALILTSLLAGMLVVIPIRQAAATGNATLSINPSTTTKLPGAVDSFFDVVLDVDTDTGLFGFDLKVAWDDDTLINMDNATSWTNTQTLLNTLWGAGNWVGIMAELGGGGGGGYYRVVALSIASSSTTGLHSLIALHFQIKKGCNFYLHTHITIDHGAKLSDINYSPITVTAYNDGMFEITARTPGLKFVQYEPDGHPFEYGKIFKIKVYVNEICATLKDYNLVIEYNAELLTRTGVDWTGSVLGTGDGESFTESTKGIINVVDLGGTTYTGLADGLLFTLVFRIEFNNDIGHIWRANNLGPLHAFIKFTAAELSFLEGGPILMGGITMPSDLDITVNLIRGDADCDGNVDVFDLRCIAAGYDKTSSDPEWTTGNYWSKYDLTSDGTIDIFDLVASATNFGYGGP